MQFLREEFIDQLQAEIDATNGNVVIEAVSFTPQQILESNSEMFELAFKEWFLNKKEERVEKANQILSLYDNADRFEALKQAYKRGMVIPFVGAGLSIPSGYPSWTDYLYLLREETEVSNNDLSILIKKGQYEEAAQLLFDALPNGSFDEHLENTFNKDPIISGCVRLLPHCFNNSVITTNFDNVLKRCYDEANCSFDEVLYGGEALEFPKLLGQGKNILLKLHGKSNTSRNRILTKNEYDGHYSDGNTLEDCMNAICQKTLLFMGCSLSADRTMKCLERLLNKKGTESAVRHYAFVELDKDTRLIRKKELAEANIFPIWYPADDVHDECLMALMEKLIEEEL